ncbi:MAG: Do family serine endopeptidase [Nitrospirota bacterium]
MKIREIKRIFIFSLLLLLSSDHNSAPLAQPMPGTFADIVDKEKPLVVNIYTTQIIKRQKAQDSYQEFFERFYGAPQKDIKKRSLGSGFIISSDGFILTNLHVINRATEIKVRLADSREFDAKLIGKDEKIDVALIKIDAPAGLPAAILGNSDAIRVGDWVIAIGNPFGLAHTVTAGIVSAKDRMIGAGPYDDFIQTDASINPGNSGGPLFNINGEVIGINTAIFAAGQGIGFAIPINMVSEILQELKEKGRVTRGWFGISVQALTPELIAALNLNVTEGALITDVDKGSPADKAGIRRGDVIIEFEGKKITDITFLPRMVARMEVGKKINLKIARNSEIREVTAVIEKMGR